MQEVFSFSSLDLLNCKLLDANSRPIYHIHSTKAGFFKRELKVTILRAQDGSCAAYIDWRARRLNINGRVLDMDKDVQNREGTLIWKWEGDRYEVTFQGTQWIVRPSLRRTSARAPMIDTRNR